MKIMNKLIFCTTLMMLPTLLFGQSLKDIVKQNSTEDGAVTYTFDVELLDTYADKIAAHALEYPPPGFKNKEEQKEIESDLKTILKLLDIIQEGNADNPEYLIRKGFLHSMGHNLDFKNSANQASDAFEKLLEIDPKNPRGNYLFGMFLSSTATGQEKSIKYLETAARLGVDDAKYTLGLLYLWQGKDNEGIACLQDYAEKYPESRASMMVQAYKDGKLKFHKSN